MRWFVSQTSLQTQKSHKNLTTNGIQGSCHRLSKGFCILLVGKVQTIHLTVVSPLVKGRCGLVVFQSTYDCTVNDHLKQYKTIAIIDVQLKNWFFSTRNSVQIKTFFSGKTVNTKVIREMSPIFVFLFQFSILILFKCHQPVNTEICLHDYTTFRNFQYIQ